MLKIILKSSNSGKLSKKLQKIKKRNVWGFLCGICGDCGNYGSLLSFYIFHVAKQKINEFALEFWSDLTAF